MSANDNPTKRAKINSNVRIEQDMFQLFSSLLDDTRRNLLAASVDRSKVEIEFRIGMLTSRDREYRRWKSLSSGVIVVDRDIRESNKLLFKAGIDETVYNRIKCILNSENFISNILPPQRMRIDFSGEQRYEVVDGAQESMIKLETKRALNKVDLACMAHNYDIRLNVATEVPTEISQSDPSQIRPWYIERLKRRTTFTRSNHAAWNIDITDVDILKRDSMEYSHEVELEFEMKSNVFMHYITSTDTAMIHKMTSLIAKELKELIDLCIPSHAEIPLLEAPSIQGNILKNIMNNIHAISDRICRTHFSHFPNMNMSNNVMRSSSTHPDHFTFIGSMPCTVNRRNLLLIQRSKYFITEKSDGTRYLLYVVSASVSGTGGGPLVTQGVFVDRSGSVVRLSGADVLGECLGVGTVLDGELVYNRKTNQTIFLIFDVLSVDGMGCSHLLFEDRMRLVEDKVMARYESCFGSLSQSSSLNSTPPIVLMKKQFYEKKMLHTLLEKLSMEGGERVHKDHERVHKSDGIIFQPNLPYVFSTDENLLKWKWPEMSSLDLKIVVNSPVEIKLVCGAVDGTEVDCAFRGKKRIAFGVYDTLRVIADIEDFGQAVNIGECIYHPAVGMWSYVQLRKDKNTPNYINTVLSIILEQAEDISIEELEFRLIGSDGGAGGGDFVMELSKCKTQLLKQLR